MIADKTYEKLKRMKESRRMSFTTLLESITEADDQKARYERLLALKGTWKSSKEDKIVENELREGWKRWNKKYVSTPM